MIIKCQPEEKIRSENRTSKFDQLVWKIVNHIEIDDLHNFFFFVATFILCASEFFFPSMHLIVECKCVKWCRPQKVAQEYGKEKNWQISD